MEEDVRKKFASLERRVRKLESQSNTTNVVSEPEVVDDYISESTKNESSGPNISFRQVITFLGVLGVIIGVISFFLYAVANNMIGETAQILIGMVVGLLLFGTSYYVKDKNRSWATVVFGGALFIELLSISIGVLTYGIMPPIVGMLFSLIFILASLFLSVTYNSRAVAYFAVAGGYLMPFITGFFNDDLFILTSNILFTIALVAISYKQKWADLRFVSFCISMFFILLSSWKFLNAPSLVVPVLYLVVMGLLFHLSSLVGMIRFPQKLSVMDAIIIGVLPVVIFIELYALLPISKSAFGLIVMLFAIATLLEITYVKKTVKELLPEVVTTFLASGFIILNAGMLFLINNVDYSYYLILFVVQQALFLYLSNKREETLLYKAFSYVFLGLTLIWTLIIIGQTPSYEPAKATIMLLVLGGTTASFFMQSRQRMDYYVTSGSFIIFGFLTLFNMSQYIHALTESREVAQICLSVFWLVYSIYMYTQVQTQAGKILTGILLGITLCKIAFVDLLFLQNVSRIVGFILFGVLLLIGGYFIGGKKDE